MALNTALQALQESEGRASGLKFNKLVMAMYWELSRALNQKLHFTVPHRWYLYGAVVDDYALRGLVRFDHPEDELKTNAVWVPPRPPKVPTGAEGSREEMWRICQDFARRYSGSDAVPALLRDHYVRAPLPFQRDFLNWSLLTRAVQRGYEADIPQRSSDLFQRLLTSFPTELEPRLTPAFQRLTLYLEPKVKGRTPGDLKLHRHAVDSLWEFWSTFCLFLSLRHNEGLPRERLQGYQSHAETELIAYKRRLSVFLEEGYSQEARDSPSRFDTSALGAFLSEEVRSTLSGGED